MLYLLQGQLSFILLELTDIKSDSKLIKNEWHCILHGSVKGRGAVLMKCNLQALGISTMANVSRENGYEGRIEASGNP